MKKVIGVILVAALLCALSATLFACSDGNRDKLLKIYMPADYIDENTAANFATWYKQETGKTVKVQIDTFETVEDIQRVVEQGKADYDLLCPSDYMVEYLLKKKLLKKVDKSIIDITEDGLIKQQYLDTSREFDPTLEYSVPYMYGTLGLMYDYRKTGTHVTSWSDLFGSHSYGISIKASMRDAYVAACLYNARESLKSLSGSDQKSAVQAVFQDTSNSTLAAAKDTLTSVTCKWDIDDVKFEMGGNKDGTKSNIGVALMWSCDAGYVMNDYEDAKGAPQQGNRNLWYVVPEEGGNVYIDCFVISKYAKNTQAANYFLKYLCETDTAVANSDGAGAISPVAAAYDELYTYYTEDPDELFTEESEEWKAMFVEMLFPSEQTLNRCGVMKDFGSRQSIVVRTWGTIKVG